MDTCYQLDGKESCVAFNSKDSHACSGFRPKLKKTEQNKTNKTSRNPTPKNGVGECTAEVMG